MAENSYKKQYGTLASLFHTGWGTESDIQFENLAYTPTVGTKWVRFSILGGEANFSSIGSPNSNSIRNTGVIVVQCFSPLGLGAMSALEMADKALNIFRCSTETNYHFKAGYVSAGSSSNGWHQVNANIPFWRDTYDFAPDPIIEEEIIEP